MSPANKWNIRNAEDLRASGFYSLPFHRIDWAGVRLGAPDPDSPRDLFVLFSKVMNLVEVLRGASMIREIDVEFRQYGRQEWHHYWVTDNEEEEEQSYPVSSDNCNIMAVPLCSLRNLKQTQFHAHSDKLDKLIDWRVIKWAGSVVANKSWAAYNPANNLVPNDWETALTLGTEIDHKTAEYYLRIHLDHVAKAKRRERNSKRPPLQDPQTVLQSQQQKYSVCIRKRNAPNSTDLPRPGEEARSRHDSALKHPAHRSMSVQ